MAGAQNIGARLPHDHSEIAIADNLAGLREKAPAILYDMIEDGQDGDLSLASLAHVLDMSATRLSQGFRISTGKTVQQYVQERRVALARDLIDATGRSLAEIAFDARVSFQSHMTA